MTSEEFLNDLDDTQAQENSGHATIKLYSDPLDHHSHQVRMTLAEKGVKAQIIDVSDGQQIAEINPYCTLPTFVGRDITLYNAQIIMEYLEERYPHPPLLPAIPKQRAQIRLAIYRLNQDIVSLVDNICGEKDRSASKKLSTKLRDQLQEWSDIFTEKAYFPPDEITLLDCIWCPILWRLPLLGVKLSRRNTAPIYEYMVRMFQRREFRCSCSQLELDLRLKN